MSPTGGRLDDCRGQPTETRPASIAEFFVRNAERAPQKLCIRFEGKNWSYGRLRRRVEAFAATLKTWGLKPGDRVALFLGNHPDFLAAYLGAPGEWRDRAGKQRVPAGGAAAHLRGRGGATLRHRRGGLVPDRRSEVRRRGRVLRDQRPEEAVDHHRRLQRVPAGGRGGTRGLPRGCGGGRCGAPRPEFVDALPRNALGQVLKHEVREKLTEGER
jgi:hypothetical protein